MLARPMMSVRRAKFILTDGEYFGTVLRLPQNPTTLEEINSAVYAEQNIFGRSRPNFQYTGGAARVWSLEIPVECLSGAIFEPGVGVEYNSGAGQGASESNLVGFDRILRIVNFLRALKEPRIFKGLTSGLYTEGVPIGPYPFLFVFGDNIILRCRMREVKINWNVFNYELDPVVVAVRCEMIETPEVAPTFGDALHLGDTVTKMPRGL